MVRITLLILLLTLSAKADFRYYTAQLDGNQVIPSASDNGVPPSAATGLLELVVDDVTGRFRMDVVLEGMQGNYLPCFLPQTIYSGAHFHLGAVGQAGPTHIYNTRNDLWVNEQGNNNPARGDWRYSATGQIFITDLQTALSNLDATNVYLNVHSDYITTGEIRGQIIPSSIPEPGTWALLGLGGLGLWLRKLQVGRASRARSN